MRERVSYLGPEGSYSSLAAKMLAPKAEQVACRSFYAAVEALLAGEVGCAVLPVENTLQGAVTQNLDLLYSHADLYAVCEYVLKIEHRLIAKEGTQLSQVRRLYSHEQAILQCGRFISNYLPQAEIVYTDSTMRMRASSARTSAPRGWRSWAKTSPTSRKTSPISSSSKRGKNICPHRASTCTLPPPARTSRGRC